MTSVLQAIPDTISMASVPLPEHPIVWSAYAVKGGIGKSTLTANIAFTLRVLNPMYRVCVVNADSTRVVQQCLGIGRDQQELTQDLYDVLQGAVDWPAVRVASPFGVDVIPLGPNRHEAARELNPKAVQTLVRNLTEHYDVVLIDLHPGAQALIPWLGVIQSVLLPVTLNASGVEAVLDTVDDLQTWRRQGLSIPDIAGVVINKWDGRMRIAKNWLDQLERVLPHEWIYPWAIRNTTAIEHAETAWQPILRESSASAQEVGRALQLITQRWLTYAFAR
ncbi:ParA family protein [Sulfobacillus thermosulfidooxidans]|uniref:ParA family protein n=1 Tax=Sulfobacillus thermosulfidooxidans TaxID=28034 RepID=UPI00030E3408|nr:ParA family protein [Sulfobacillus thermosulfidooxidans]